MYQQRRKSGLLLLGAVIVAVSAHANEANQADKIAFFEKHIRPTLAEHCYKCHSTRTGKRQGGLLLDSRPGWAAGGENGEVIVPGDVEASRLIQAVRHTNPDLQMPPDKPLSAEAIARLEEWVRMGAPDPREKAESATEPGRTPPSDPVAGREHWAFRPIKVSPPALIAQSDWARSSIDRYVLAQLQAAKLQPATDADRRTLLRRTCFQLIGLPPTQEQTVAFLADDRPDAFERLVDGLLDSPQFGERWGRHWLDLARFADSNGLDENFLFREAWRYRNWVIGAVNRDMPFDRFLLEQLAGDLLPHESIEQRDRQRIAAGFLLVGPKVLLGNDEKNQRMEIADEQIDTIGRAILGQTLGCARCHDHKFDPIPTADYYALAGIFTSTKVMEMRHMLNEQRVMERLVGLGPEGTELDDAYEKYWRERAQSQDKRKHAKSALDLLEKDDAKGLEEILAKHRNAFADEAADAALPKGKRIEAQKAFLATLDAAMKNPPKIPPRAMIPCDDEKPDDECIRLAGQFNRLGEKVPRGFLRVASNSKVEIPSGQSGRLQLSHWLTDVEQGAGQLAARVFANRVWHHLVGRGIVRTVDNFGRTGEAPSHPELLDYLAKQLIDSGWSVKSLVREVVLSRTFAMSSHHDEVAHGIDPENRLLWRAHRRRLDPESLRDAMLMAAGELDLKPMDSTVSYLDDQATAVGDNKNRRRTNFPCRSVYLPVIRNDLPELFEAFDFANPHTTTGMRPQTMVPTQGLFILNDEMVMKAADATARRLLSRSSNPQPSLIETMIDSADRPSNRGNGFLNLVREVNRRVLAEAAKQQKSPELSELTPEQRGTYEERADKLYELVFASPAPPEDREQMIRFVCGMTGRLAAEGEADAELRAWSMACHALFASSRFQILD